LRDAVAAYRIDAKGDDLEAFFGVWAERIKTRS